LFLYRHQTTNVTSTDITAPIYLAVICGALRFSCSVNKDSILLGCDAVKLLLWHSKLVLHSFENTRKFTPNDTAYIPEDLNYKENNIEPFKDET